jgi:hypothetical protein
VIRGLIDFNHKGHEGHEGINIKDAFGGVHAQQLPPGRYDGCKEFLKHNSFVSFVSLVVNVGLRTAYDIG